MMPLRGAAEFARDCGRPGCGCGILYYAGYCPKCRFLARFAERLDRHRHIAFVRVTSEKDWVTMFGNSAGPRFIGTEGVTLVGLWRVVPRVLRELIPFHFSRAVKPRRESEL